MRRDSVLAHTAAQAPEAPFAFFRGTRGQFEWISFQDAEDLRLGTPGRPRWLPADLVELLRFAAELEPAVVPASLPPGPARDVWIAWRPLSVPAEADLAAWAVRTGAAIVVERHERIPTGLIEWARPTLLSDTVDSLEDLLAGLERDAPKWLRRRWFRQHLGRLRLTLVEGTPSGASIDRLRTTLARLVPDRTVEVERFSSVVHSALV